MTDDDASARTGEAARQGTVSPPAKRPASSWRRRLVLAAGPVALAAAMVVYVTSQSGPRAPELPRYTVTAQVMRGAAEASPRLRIERDAPRATRFELLLRPATAPDGKVVAYAFTLGGPASEPTPLEARIELAPEGAVKLTGNLSALDGASEIRIVVGAPAAVGKFDDAAARARSGSSDRHVHVVTVPVDRD